MKLSINNWHFVLGRGQHPVIILDALGRGHRSSFSKVMDCHFNTPNWIRYEGRTYIIEKDYQKIIQLLERWIKKDPGKLKKLIESGNKLMWILIKRTAQWKKLHLRKLSDKVATLKIGEDGGQFSVNSPIDKALIISSAQPLLEL